MERNTNFHKIVEAERLASLDLKQKSRVKWMRDGDENTKFFHGFINNKNRRTRLNGLTINGLWTTDVKKIKCEVMRFYNDKFKEKWVSRP